MSETTSMSSQGTESFTFFFTDIEGSSSLWEQEPEGMKVALTRHNALIRGAVETYEGLVFKTFGDSVCAVFAQAYMAVRAALLAQLAILKERWPLPSGLRVRMALHAGHAEMGEEDYYGPTVNRCARLLSLARGGQILLSAAIVEQVRDALPRNARLKDLGEHELRGLSQPERIYLLVHPDLPVAPLVLRGQELTAEIPRQLSQLGKRSSQLIDEYRGKMQRLLELVLQQTQQLVGDEIEQDRGILSPLPVPHKPSVPKGAFPSSIESQTECQQESIGQHATHASHPLSQAVKRCYEAFGLEEGTDFAVVRRRYMELMKRCEPSRFPEGSEERARAERVQAQLQQAYHTLLKHFDVTSERFGDLDLG